MYEGGTGASYCDVLLPRPMAEIVNARGVRHSEVPDAPAVRLPRNGVEATAKEICNAREAFHLLFIHADAGGRAQEAHIDRRSTACCEAAHALCEWPRVRCATIVPRHETEAWVLADPDAVMSALGYIGTPESLGLPLDALRAERLADPKAMLTDAAQRARGRRRGSDVTRLFPAIAQRQKFDRLQQSPSFRNFETGLIAALKDLGCL